MSKLNYVEDTMNMHFEILIQRLIGYRIQFLDGIVQYARDLMALGLNEDAISREILDKIYNEDGKIKIENQETKELWNMVKSVSQFTVYGGLGEGMYRWQLGGGKHCQDCADRAGKEDTLNGWSMKGLPGSGATACHFNCNCDIVAVSKK